MAIVENVFTSVSLQEVGLISIPTRCAPQVMALVSSVFSLPLARCSDIYLLDTHEKQRNVVC